MRHLDEMDTFVKVVTHRSFAAAAKEIGISAASVTRRIMLLEQSLGVKLLSRNTRKLSMTEAGERYFSFADRILGEIRKEEFDIGRLNQEADGPLKLVVSKSFGNLHMGQAVADFMARYPKIRTSVLVSDVSLSSLDPIEHGFDLAIRLGEPTNTRLFSQRIGAANWIACASPDYLERAGKPETPEDLADHSCVIHQMYFPGGKWTFRNGQGSRTVRVSGLATTNSVIVARHIALNGLGITLLPTYCAAADLKNGALQRVLEKYTLPSQTIRALYPHSRFQPKKVKLFVDFLRQRFRASEWVY